MSKARRVNAINETKFNGDKNDDMAMAWDARCLAEYFFFAYIDKDEYDLFYNSNDEYINGNTKMEVIKSRKRICIKRNGKSYYRFTQNEIIIIYKRNPKYGHWYEILTTDDMDEVCELFEIMKDYYYTMGFNVSYDTFITNYNAL